MFINYRLADGNTALVEVTEEVAEFILEDDRLTANADRREHYHCPYHIEAMDYEGDSLAYRLSPEEIYIRKETQLEHNKALSLLTDTQLRRLPVTHIFPFVYSSCICKEYIRQKFTDRENYDMKATGLEVIHIDG